MDLIGKEAWLLSTGGKLLLMANLVIQLNECDPLSFRLWDLECCSSSCIRHVLQLFNLLLLDLISVTNVSHACSQGNKDSHSTYECLIKLHKFYIGLLLQKMAASAD